jgi:hypothetical protein
MSRSVSVSSSQDLLASPLATLLPAGPDLTPDRPSAPTMGLESATGVSAGRSQSHGMQDRLTDLLKEKGVLESCLETGNLDREKFGRKQSGVDSAREKAKWAEKRLATEASLDRHQVRFREVEKELKFLKSLMNAHQAGGRSVEADSKVERNSARRPNFASNAITMRLMGGLALCVHRIGDAFRGMFGTLESDEQKRLLEERTRSRERLDNRNLVAAKGGPSLTPELERKLNSDTDADAANPFNQESNPFSRSRVSGRNSGLSPKR